MKGQLERFRKKQRRQTVNSYPNGMEAYARTLKHLVEASGNGSVPSAAKEKLVPRLKANEVYGVICPDNKDYYRTVMIKTVPLTGGFQTFISNPVYGTVPDHMQIADSAQVFKQMRDMNSSMSLTSMEAFPHKGVTNSTYRAGDAGIHSTGVSDLHQRQQKRGLL